MRGIREMRVRAVFGWGAVCALCLALTLVPFFLFETKIMGAVDVLLREYHGRQLLAVALGALLAADIVLPVPSSLISTACGSLLGFWGGMFVSWVGMTAGCVVGYFIGSSAGAGTVNYLAGERELARVSRVAERHGPWVIILFRAVPVLAEVSAMFAGVCRMPLWRFVGISALSNLGISAAYAWVGSAAADANSFLLAFVGALVFPAIPWGLARLFKS